MLNQIRIPPIFKAIRQSIQQFKPSIGSLQQQRPGIRTDPSAIEGRHYATLLNTRKFQLLRATLCLHRDTPVGVVNSFWYNKFLSLTGPMHLFTVRYPG